MKTSLLVMLALGLCFGGCSTPAEQKFTKTKAGVKDQESVKKNPWYDYTHPWLKFSINASGQAGVTVPEIAIAEVKKRIGAMPGTKIPRGARTPPGWVGPDGNPPNPNTYAKWKDQKMRLMLGMVKHIGTLTLYERLSRKY